MAPSTIFITGATGFIGHHVLQRTLEAGYKVRLSVRKADQVDVLKRKFSTYASALDFVVIPDITIPKAFDAGLQGVDYVFHIASPMPGKGSDFKTDYLAPAAHGTTAILDAAIRVPSIKRLVIVSSLLGMIPLGALSTTFHVKEEGANRSLNVDPDMPFPDGAAGAGIKYCASKILAHRATLDWADSNKPHFALITLHPSFVFGRNLSQTTAEDIDGTNAMLWNSLFSDKPAIPMTSVDVRDVADAHLKALDVAVQDGVNEFLLNGEGWSWDGVVDMVRKEYPDLGITLRGPFGENSTVDTERAEEILGVKWTKMEDTLRALVDQQVDLRS